MAYSNLSSDEEKKLLEYLQDFLQDGVALVIGSGFSAGYGLPGMPALAAHLQATVPTCLTTTADQTAWNTITDRLTAGDGLESALQSTTVSVTLLELITRESAFCIDAKECDALRAIASDSAIPSLGRLSQHILKASRRFHIITPNYDRLIEYQLEHAAIPVDSGYVGTYIARYDADRSALANKEYLNEGKRVRAIHHPHAQLHKPHGSLDWYILNNQVIRSSQCLELPRAIVSPGLTKYQSGYSTHFNQQHTSATKALEKAPRILAIGYGFNDDQLEHSWCPNLNTAKQIVVLTKALSGNALRLVQAGQTVYALTENPADTATSLLYQGSGDPKIFSRPIWTVTNFVQEVIR